MFSVHVIIYNLIGRLYDGLLFSIILHSHIAHPPDAAGVEVSPSKWDHVRRTPMVDRVLTSFPIALVTTNPDKNNSRFMLDSYKIIIVIFCHLQSP